MKFQDNLSTQQNERVLKGERETRRHHGTMRNNPSRVTNACGYVWKNGCGFCGEKKTNKNKTFLIPGLLLSSALSLDSYQMKSEKKTGDNNIHIKIII